MQAISLIHAQSAWRAMMSDGVLDRASLMQGSRLTLTVPEAGCVLGVGRNAAYQAARTGDIPTIRIGKRILVPVAALERMLEQPSAE